MTSIFATTELKQTILSFLAGENRLGEFLNVTYQDIIEVDQVPANTLLIEGQSIHNGIYWQNSVPPVLFPPKLPLEKELFLGIIYYYLHEFELALHWLAQSDHAKGTTEAIKVLLTGASTLISKEPQNHADAHNQAVCLHYMANVVGAQIDQIELAYTNALSLAEGKEAYAFTVSQAATFLADIGKVQLALEWLGNALEGQVSISARMNLIGLQSSILVDHPGLIEDNGKEKLKANVKELIGYYEKVGDLVQLGKALMLAGSLAVAEANFSEAVTLLGKAINAYGEAEIPELAAEAHMQKGTVLSTWAQQGMPHFFASSIEAFQAALKVYNREEFPLAFAEIHHQLGTVYARMPAPQQKKAMLAALSVTSFQEAMLFFSKDAYPYEFARIQNNFGNAYLIYPESLHTDNYRKAISCYQLALEVQTKESHPHERAITLLNMLEACWLMPQEEKASFNQGLYEEMCAMATEIGELTQDEELIGQAKKHLEQLDELHKSNQYA